MNKFLSLTTYIVTAGIIFSGCGGGGSSSDSTKTGYLVDDPIEGVDYNCSSRSGTTGTNGDFHYKSGDRCVFSVGNLIIGEADPDKGLRRKGFVTPMDLADVNKTDDLKVKKIAKFFLTFGKSSDGKIVIKDDIKKDFKKDSYNGKNLTSDKFLVEDIIDDFDPSKISKADDKQINDHLKNIDKAIKEIQKEEAKNPNSASFTAVDIPLDSIKNKKIIFNNGKSYVEIREDGSFNLSDGKERGDGSWEYKNKTLYLWKGEPYEYTIQFSNTPSTGVKIKITEHTDEGKEEVKYLKITNIVSADNN